MQRNATRRMKNALVRGRTNKMLGMLMPIKQISACPRRVRLNNAALLNAFKAHAKSVIEHRSVIWSGAAITRIARLERLQHRFLMWLALTLVTRAALWNTTVFCPISASHLQRPDSSRLILHSSTTYSITGWTVLIYITALFGLATPVRRSRNTGLFHIPFGRSSPLSLPERLSHLTDFFKTSHRPTSSIRHSDPIFAVLSAVWTLLSRSRHVVAVNCLRAF